jgi:hypothetical protein
MAKEKSDGLEEFEVIEGELVPDTEQHELTMQILMTTRNPVEIRAETLSALSTIEDGRVPPHALQTRQGSGGKDIPYASHVWVTRLLNSAFRWLWDYECLEYQVHDDGSVSSRNRLTVNLPIGKLPDGTPLYHKRVTTEIGAFEAYNKYEEVQKEVDGQMRRINQKKVDPITGQYEYTMATSDRVASSVSRGLVKAVARMFNIGLELIEDKVEMTDLDAWNILLRNGKNQGLDREQIIEVVREAGITKDNIVEKFQVGFAAVYNAARKQIIEEVPDL